MRFMIIVRATPETEAEGSPLPEDESVLPAMLAYHDELAKAGVLLDGNGLKPSRHGWRIRYGDGQRRQVDGPFAETKELIAGYTLIQTRSREEAVEWARRFPAPMGALADGEVEVRQLYELDDLPPGAALERFRELQAPQG